MIFKFRITECAFFIACKTVLKPNYYDSLLLYYSVCVWSENLATIHQRLQTSALRNTDSFHQVKMPFHHGREGYLCQKEPIKDACWSNDILLVSWPGHRFKAFYREHSIKNFLPLRTVTDYCNYVLIKCTRKRLPVGNWWN